MNRKLFWIPLILLLINFACQKESGQKPKTPQKTPKKYSFVIKRKGELEDYASLQADKRTNAQDFFKLVETFQPRSFSLDELIDLTEKDLKLMPTIKSKRLKPSMDTAAIKSRIVLTEVYLHKLKYLVHKKKPEKDTIAKTVNAIVNNLNSVIRQMKIYNGSTDEFESILHHDSIVQNNKEQLKDIQSPPKKPAKNKKLKEFDKFKAPSFIKNKK